jgi:mannonate dehydratase
MSEMMGARAGGPFFMEQSMRWFGPADPVSLPDLRQAGCEGVVTALHHIPNGAVWPVADIAARKREIEAHGMRWSAVESLPVDERIKTQRPGFETCIDNYIASLRNLAACGIDVVTYNFMPLLDWTRTDLAFTLPDGGRALKFELDAVAAYDIHMLRRPNAQRDYSPAIAAAAAARFASMDDAQRLQLERTIIKGLPGSEESFTSRDFLAAIEGYAGIDHARLRDHLTYFLERVCPVADELGLRMAIHPDDPPYTMFGLPRVVSTEDDVAVLFARVPNPSNGLCFCAGSFSIRPDNDLVRMVERFGARIWFTHLRNTRRELNGDFYESPHLDGSVDMAAVVHALCRAGQRHARRIVMRPDHGHQILDDLKKSTNPGYSAIGRLKGLAELRGLELGIMRSDPALRPAG